MVSVNSFTVLMAVYYKDNPSLFSRALESVYANSIVPAEVILVVDGPIPTEISDIIVSFEKKLGLRPIYLSSNMGLANALNEGLKHVTYDWVFRADSDDINLKNRFELQLKMIDGDIDLIGGAILEVDLDGSPISVRRPPLDHNDIIKHLPYRNPFNHMTVAFKKKVVTSAGGYPLVHLKEDYALWASILSRGAKAKNTSEVLVHATTGRGMLARRGGVRYVISEFKFQRHLFNCGFQSYINSLLVGSLRSFVFLMPNFIRGFIYKRFLRKSVSEKCVES